MNRKATTQQLALFPDELPTWETLPTERQLELLDVLARLLERTLRQPTQPSQSTHDPENQTENLHV